MKTIQGGKKGCVSTPECVDGANGEEEIVEKFRQVYFKLYNSVGTETEMSELAVRVEKMISGVSATEVKKVTGSKVKEAVNKMKAKKSDVSGGVTSDALLNAPDILFDRLAAVFRSWLFHGTESKSLLACAFH